MVKHNNLLHVVNLKRNQEELEKVQTLTFEFSTFNVID